MTTTMRLPLWQLSPSFQPAQPRPTAPNQGIADAGM